MQTAFVSQLERELGVRNKAGEFDLLLSEPVHVSYVRINRSKLVIIEK